MSCSPRSSLKWGARDGGVYDKHRDGSAVYHAPSGYVRHYNPPYYSDEDRSDCSSESPDETDSERDDYREVRGPGRGHYVLDDRRVVRPPDSDSSSSEDVPDSESETETEDCSGRYVPEEYESGSGYDRDDRDSYGDSYDDDDYDGYGEYDGIPILLLARFPTSVYSFIPHLRRRLRLLSLD
jgi:hypothetical protein